MLVGSYHQFLSALMLIFLICDSVLLLAVSKLKAALRVIDGSIVPALADLNQLAESALQLIRN
jgi:hypothetical protein